jgi:hypothetical protein
MTCATVEEWLQNQDSFSFVGVESGCVRAHEGVHCDEANGSGGGVS